MNPMDPTKPALWLLHLQAEKAALEEQKARTEEAYLR